MYTDLTRNVNINRSQVILGLRNRQGCVTQVLHWPRHDTEGFAMTTTTIRLPDELKARVSKAAKRAGTTSHSFILEAIAEKTARAEQRADFDSVAEQRFSRLLETGQTIPWDEMRAYLETRAKGKTARQPSARKLG